MSESLWCREHQIENEYVRYDQMTYEEWHQGYMWPEEWIEYYWCDPKAGKRRTPR
jgi:hypothetical protein